MILLSEVLFLFLPFRTACMILTWTSMGCTWTGIGNETPIKNNLPIYIRILDFENLIFRYGIFPSRCRPLHKTGQCITGSRSIYRWHPSFFSSLRLKVSRLNKVSVKYYKEGSFVLKFRSPGTSMSNFSLVSFRNRAHWPLDEVAHIP